MIAHQPALSRVRALPSPALGSLGAPEPPPPIDPIYTSFTDIPGILETLLVVGITGTAGYSGIRTGLDAYNSGMVRTIGWVGGVGSALLGLLYLSAKVGLNDYVGLPAVRVSPS